jgi:hypothetical protein
LTDKENEMPHARFAAILFELQSLHSSMQTVSGRQAVQLRISMLKIHQRNAKR